MNAAQCLLAGGDDASLALVSVDERWRRGELRAAVARAASAWRGLGLARGERVAVRLADGADWVVAYLGAIWAGGVAVGVSPRAPAGEWQTMLDESGFRFVLAEAIDADVAARTTPVAPAAWQRELQRSTPIDPLPMDEREPALWVHSSGTSGRPKAVVHAHRFAIEVERAGRERIGIGANDRLLASSKLFFTYPLANSVFTGLKVGATVLLDRRWPSAADFVATAIAQRASVVFSVPSLYRDVLKLGLASALANAGVRVFVSAGEALSPALRAQWHEQTGAMIVDGFGTSETLVLALVDRGDGRALQPSPGFSVTNVAGDDDAPARLLIRGPSVALGYWRRPDADAAHFRDDGFASSDLFEATADGWRFAGRDDSLVKVHGRWVDLNALEQEIALACPGIREAAAVAVADDDGVDAVALFFVAAADVVVPDETTLRAHADRLPRYQRPRWLHRVDSLPRTGTGKLLRRRLRELHGELAASAIGEANPAH